MIALPQEPSFEGVRAEVVLALVAAEVEVEVGVVAAVVVFAPDDDVEEELVKDEQTADYIDGIY